MSGKATHCRSGKLKEKIEVFKASCRAAGLKITPQRMAVYRALIETDEHPSAETVFRKLRGIFPNISLDTVNRTLLTLSEIGAASVVAGSGDAKRFDADMENHQHFKCIRCKRIIDFHYRPFDNIKVPASIGRRFTVLKRTVCIEGICDLCRTKGGNK